MISPHMYNDIPPRYSNFKGWYPHSTEHPHGTHDIPHVHYDIPTVLKISPTVLNTPHGTQDIPHSTEHPHGIQDIPHGTHDIPHGTEHPPRYCTHIIQGDNNFKCRFCQKTSLAIKIGLSQLKFLINIQEMYAMVPRPQFQSSFFTRSKL